MPTYPQDVLRVSTAKGRLTCHRASTGSATGTSTARPVNR